MFFNRHPSVEWILACLGNPGAKYELTRHNVGFMTADALAARQGVKVNRLRFKALTAELRAGGKRALIVKPQTFMNLSGDSVREAAAFYKLPPERVIAVFDDVSLPFGKLRARPDGSAGGHNGIKHIISRLGTESFPRLKLGVGEKPHPDMDLADWVLKKFDKSEMDTLDGMISRAADAAVHIIANGIESAMNEFN